VIAPGITYSAQDDVGTASLTIPNVVVDPGKLACLVVRVGNRIQTVSILSITWGGKSLSQHAFIAGTNCRASLWYAVGLTAGTNNVVITFSAATKSVGFATVSYYVDQFGPLGNAFTASGMSAAPLVNVTNSNPVPGDTLARDVVVAQFSLMQTLTVGAGQTQEGQETTTGGAVPGNIQVGVSREVPAVNPTPMEWTISASQQWAMVGTYLKPAIIYTGFAWIVNPPTVSLGSKTVDAELEARVRNLENQVGQHERKVRSRI
jgi:hypothetical protein